MIGNAIKEDVESSITGYAASRLSSLLSPVGPFAIKFVQSRWAGKYAVPTPLRISDTPALTWGTATYITPLVFPLSSALYGRIGLVTPFDPNGWRVFDATTAKGRMAYVRWVRAQPSFPQLVLTVHSTHANHILRNKFREDFMIDCVIFHPDQEAEVHTDSGQHVWMAVTDWTSAGAIATGMSGRLDSARFVVLIDEEFDLEHNGLPIQRAERKIEKVTEKITPQSCVEIPAARMDPNFPREIIQHYMQGGYLHVYIKP